MPWEFDRDRPIYAQLVDRLSRDIVAGVLLPGSKLDSVRELAASAGVNPNTMQKALAELEQQGLVFTQRTTGRYVTEDTEKLASLKKQLAVEQITHFFCRMDALGYQKGACLALMEEVAANG